MSDRARCPRDLVVLSPRMLLALLAGLLAVVAGVTCRAAGEASTPGAATSAQEVIVPVGTATLRAPLDVAHGAPLAAAGAPPAAVAAPASGLSPTGASAASPAKPATAAADPTPAAEDIRDIRGPKYGLPLWVVVASIAGAALLALAAYGIRRWRRRLRPRVLLPFEQALQQLDGIRPLMQPASAREFSIAVSDIVRGYIEQRFDVIATHRTTEEFMHDLLETAKPSLARHRSLLAEFLQQCDLVKFGGMSLSMRSIESLHDSARGFVLETAKPDPVAPVTAANPREAHDTLPAA